MLLMQNRPLEIWKSVCGYEDIYEVSNTGKIRSLNYLKTGTISEMSPHKKEGYKRIELCKKGMRKKFYVHRLVAEAFIENPEQKEFINHVDGNKSNNCSWNLEWVTCRENNIHAIKTGLNKSKGMPQKNRNASVKQIDPVTGKLINIFSSIKEASESINRHRSTIYNACIGKQKTAGGFIWEFRK
ncbi:hypothetical protein COJ86_00255 [Bacillus cereus]|nr:hypothetical protein COJ86_00255 [Bacillus cereus]